MKITVSRDHFPFHHVGIRCLIAETHLSFTHLMDGQMNPITHKF